MGFAQARQTIETYISANWMQTPTHFDNTPFDIPAAGHWIRVNILPGTGFAETVGVSGYNLYNNLLSISIFVPDNTGTTTVLGYVDDIKNLFNRKTLGNLQFNVAAVRTATSPYEGYIRYVVDIPFWYVEPNI